MLKRSVPVHVTEQEDVVPDDLRRCWVDAIKRDDIEEVQFILETVDEDVGTFLLTKQLPLWQPASCGHTACDCYPPYISIIARYTLFIAFAGPSMKVLALLLQNYKVDFLLKDVNSVNILHSMLYSSYFRKCHEKQYVECYSWLSRNLDKGIVQQLLKEETTTGLKPLELALQLDLFSMFTAIINTQDVYLAKQEVYLFCSYKWYDVTEYEHPRYYRPGKSPLFILSLLDHQNLSTPEAQQFLSSPLITTWFKKRMRVLNQPVIFFIILFIFRFILMLAMFGTKLLGDGLSLEAINSKESNNDSAILPSGEASGCLPRPLPLWSEILLLAITCLHPILWLGVSLLWIRRFRNSYELLCARPGNPKKPAVDTHFYLAVEYVLNISVLVKITSAIFGYTLGCYIPKYFIYGTDVLFLLSFLWSIMFLIQLSSVGYFVTMVQHMLGDVIRFYTVFHLFQTTFSMLFFLIITSYGKHCERGSPGFTSPIESFYGMLGIMLNTISLNTMPYQIHGAEERIIMAILHIVYVLMVPIMLINLLIALFSDTVSKIAPYKSHIMTFQRYRVTEHIQWFMHKFASRYYEKKLKSSYATENSRIYLVVTETEDAIQSLLN